MSNYFIQLVPNNFESLLVQNPFYSLLFPCILDSFLIHCFVGSNNPLHKQLPQRFLQANVVVLWNIQFCRCRMSGHLLFFQGIINERDWISLEFQGKQFLRRGLALIVVVKIIDSYML